MIEKRVRKEMRVNSLLSKNDRALILDDGTEKGAVCTFLLKKIIKDPTIKFVVEKISGHNISGGYGRTGYGRTSRYNKIIVPWTLDDEASYYLKSMFENHKNPKHLLHGKKMIKPLIGVTREEAAEFAGIKRLRYTSSKPFDMDIQKMIDTMEAKYPGTKPGILKNIRKSK